MDTIDLTPTPEGLRMSIRPFEQTIAHCERLIGVAEEWQEMMEVERRVYISPDKFHIFEAALEAYGSRSASALSRCGSASSRRARSDLDLPNQYPNYRQSCGSMRRRLQDFMTTVGGAELNLIICGSISAVAEIVKAKERLESLGHQVEIPAGVRREFLRARTEVSTSEKAEDKILGDLIRGYYGKIGQADAVLVVNPEKRGVPGYIGGNTFLEMGFAFVQDKPLFLMNPIPDLPYTSEMIAMTPTILHGDLSLIAKGVPSG
jgi:hypothetical protein